MITTNIQYQVMNSHNGSLIKQGTVHCKEGEDYTDLAAIRRVKKAIGWNGKRTTTEPEGNAIMLLCDTSDMHCLITFHSFGSAS